MSGEVIRIIKRNIKVVGVKMKMVIGI